MSSDRGKITCEVLKGVLQHIAVASVAGMALAIGSVGLTATAQASVSTTTTVNATIDSDSLVAAGYRLVKGIVKGNPDNDEEFLIGAIVMSEKEGMNE